MKEVQSTLFAEDFLVKTSQSQVVDEAWLENGLQCGLSLEESLKVLHQSGLLLKMFPVYSLHRVVETFPPSFKGWQRSGMVWAGEFWTAKVLDLPNGAKECLLSGVLEAQVDARYYLTPKACAGIIERASARGKPIPEPLLTALKNRAQELK